MSAGTSVSGEVAEVPALAPSQAAIEARLARNAFFDALERWWDCTPREFGDLAEKWWHSLFVLRQTIVGES